MKELNLLTKRLLSEGYTKESPPDYVRPWNDFYGGFEYSLQFQNKMLFETPCGLQVTGNHWRSGTMWFMGVEWTCENNNPTIRCPYNKTGCEKNHQLLRDHISCGDMVMCACHEIDDEYDYEKSIDKVRDLKRKREEALFEEFKVSKKGRVCPEMCRFNEEKDTWEQRYNPVNICSSRACRYCLILGKELTSKKGNVFYDLKTVRENTEDSLFNTGDIVTVTKGRRLFEKNCSLDICEIVTKSFKDTIIRKERNKHHSDLFFSEYHGRKFVLEVINVRAEYRVSRDLEQDLEDIQNGITIIHESDHKQEVKESKRERKQKALEGRIRKCKKMVCSSGFDNLDITNKMRIEKLIAQGLISSEDLDAWQSEYDAKQKQQQLYLF